jgi:hypothetical protein
MRQYADARSGRSVGVITAHVPGPNAKHYRFTSALPTQILKVLAPDLTPLLRSHPPLTVPGNGQMIASAPTGIHANVVSTEGPPVTRISK